MPSIRQLRRRIRGVQNTRQITRAMELVASSRLRRAQERVLASRPYAERIRAVISNLAAVSGAQELHPLLQVRPVSHAALILFTTSRGLCGSLNSNMVRAVVRFILDRGVSVDIIAVGTKGPTLLRSVGLSGSVAAQYQDLGNYPNVADILPISRSTIEGFTTARYDEVYVGYSQFVNLMRQEPTLLRILPIAPEELESSEASAYHQVDYIYEPDPDAVLSNLLPRFIEAQVYRALLESIASEHSARMIAMRNATENAEEILQDLTLTYNKVRQTAITNEVIEIATAAKAIAGV
ncbi:MAG: ATP synthase F1 subunit gamma [Chloroflexota bacterium]|nr:ATP synthase F1 subunit gamma [Chloroflexota bacterium]MDE2839055.1 ATP synthase F1 subunit gamma [Chloroflexota bacterium]MDE2931201.1 ATP synthase F1 subunit gamma [Chloroflexota bacterium]